MSKKKNIHTSSSISDTIGYPSVLEGRQCARCYSVHLWDPIARVWANSLYYDGVEWFKSLLIHWQLRQYVLQMVLDILSVQHPSAPEISMSIVLHASFAALIDLDSHPDWLSRNSKPAVSTIRQSEQNYATRAAWIPDTRTTIISVVNHKQGGSRLTE